MKTEEDWGLIEDRIQCMEEWAFYESGLVAHGCLENLDQFARDSIKRYGRLLMKELLDNPDEFDYHQNNETQTQDSKLAN